MVVIVLLTTLLTRSSGDAIYVYGASSAKARSTTEFRAGEVQMVTKNPKNRGVSVCINRVNFAVDAY